MMTVIAKLRTGTFNHMSQEHQPDGSLLVTLTKRGDPHVYRMWVKDLYTKDEVVLKEESITCHPVLNPVLDTG